jgi:hypothetical protein
VLIKTGAPISRSRTLEQCLVCDADLACPNFSLMHLKSGRIDVDDCICGDVETLRACRAFLAAKDWPDGGYVADLGPPM